MTPIAEHVVDPAEAKRLRQRLDRLSALGEQRFADAAQERERIAELEAFLQLSPKAEARLEQLSTALFGELLDEVEANLTHAVREILGQDRTVASTRETKHNRLHVNFHIYSGGDEDAVEDVLTGQGGSVCNILSVGLRLIALSQLDPELHRPFLVLDEQDCWLRPQLVPRLMRLIAEIAKRLDLQLLVISHHGVDLFADVADRVFQLAPDRDNGVKVERMK